MGPLFFLSYASNEKLKHFHERFFDDLVGALVAERDNLSSTPGAVGFYDRAGIQLGGSWTTELAEALRTARVFVYIQSDAYFDRTWCGREWAVFRDRIDRWLKSTKPPAARPPLMLPVLWKPASRNPPATIATDIQHSHRELGERYLEHGLHGLMDLERLRDDYRLFLSQLARRILQVADDHALPPGETAVIAFETIPNAFVAPRETSESAPATGARESQAGASASQSAGATAFNLVSPFEVVLRRRIPKREDVATIANLTIHPEGNCFAFSLDGELWYQRLEESRNFANFLGDSESVGPFTSVSRRRYPIASVESEDAPVPQLEDFRVSEQEEAHEYRRISALCFSPCGRYLLSGDNAGYVRLWDFARRTCLCTLSDHDQEVTSICFSPRGTEFATTGYDETILVFDLQSCVDAQPEIIQELGKRSLIRKNPKHPHAHDFEHILAMTFSPCGEHLATGDDHGVIRVREIASGRDQFRSWKAHTQRVRSICFSPAHPEILATASDDRRIRLLNCRTHDVETLGIREDKHTEALNSISFSFQGDVLVSSARDARVKIWDVEKRLLLKSIPTEPGALVDRVAFFPNRYDFATDSFASDITLWGLSNQTDLTNITLSERRESV